MHFVISSLPQELLIINVSVSSEIVFSGGVSSAWLSTYLVREMEVMWGRSNVLLWVLHFTKARETGKQ